MRKLFILTLTFLFAYPLVGQDFEYARKIIDTLASPVFQGRGYTANGNILAAEYIKDQYEKLGLKTFGKDFYQPFKIEVNIFPGNMNLKFNDVELVPGEEFLVDPLSSPVRGEFKVQVIKKQELLDEEKVREVMQQTVGKFLVIDEREFFPGKEGDREKVEELINFLKYNPKVPTAGTIILTGNKLTWGNATLQATKPSFTVKKDFSLEDLEQVKVDVDAKMEKYKPRNVIGYLEGIKEPDSFLVVTAHYDHLGMMGKNTYFPGANDNASGVAMILSLAKHYSENPPGYSIVFISLSAEEIGLVGAKHYVDNPLFDLDKIKFLVNFDLAGTGDEGIKVVNGKVYQDKFNLLASFNEKNNYLPSIQIRGEACISDHCMFYKKGVPCFYIYTLGGIQAYHDVYDKAETLPLTEFEDYSKLIIDFFDNID